MQERGHHMLARRRRLRLLEAHTTPLNSQICCSVISLEAMPFFVLLVQRVMMVGE
jgi:hypothetical protein